MDIFWNHTFPPWGWEEGTLDPCLGKGVLLRVWNPEPVYDKKTQKYQPCWDNTLHFRSLFGTNEKIHTPLFNRILKCFKDELNTVYAIFNNDNCTGHPLFTTSSDPVYDRLTQNYIPCLGQRGQKPYPVQQH